MTLEEAIEHCEEVIKGNENLMAIHMMNACYDSVDMCNKCNEEHRQLAEWLKELKRQREAWEKVKAEIASLKGDNFPNSYYIKIIDKHLQEVTTDADSN